MGAVWWPVISCYDEIVILFKSTYGEIEKIPIGTWINFIAQPIKSFSVLCKVVQGGYIYGHLKIKKIELDVFKKCDNSSIS